MPFYVPDFLVSPIFPVAGVFNINLCLFSICNLASLFPKQIWNYAVFTDIRRKFFYNTIPYSKQVARAFKESFLFGKLFSYLVNACKEKMRPIAIFSAS